MARNFFRLLLPLIAALLLPATVAAEPAPAAAAAALRVRTIPRTPVYRIRLYHTHTQEHINIVYRRGDTYLPEAIAKLEYFLRDHRTGDVHSIDPHLFDLLHDLTRAVRRPGAEIDVICGYRTPESNDYLRSLSPNVAEHSLHMDAEAIDIRIRGVRTRRLRDAALRMERGGVGYYPRARFVHVDIGRVRWW